MFERVLQIGEKNSSRLVAATDFIGSIIMNFMKFVLYFCLFICLTWGCKSSPEITTTKLKFLVVGDWGRNGTQNQQEIANQMNTTAINENVDFIISTGDNFYETGVKSMQDSQWKTSFEDIYIGNALQKEWFVVLGNHDYQGNPQAQIDYSKTSNRWKMPSRYYTFTKTIDSASAVRFVFIDTSPFVNEYLQNPNGFSDLAQQDTKKQLYWIDSVLTNSTEKWKIVIGHHPIYSAGFGHGNQEELINQMKPILEKNKVQMYLCGHSHSSQYINRNDTITDFVVAGAGSSTIEFIAPSSSVDFGTATPSFSLVSLSKDNLTTSFIDMFGKTLFTESWSF